MTDSKKSKSELIAENAALRRQLADCERRQEQDGPSEDERWRSVVSSAPAFIALVNQAGVITFLNHAQPGMTINDSIGRTVFEFTHPDYHAVLQSSLDAAFTEQRNGFFTSVAAGPNGEESWYDTYVAPVTVGGRVTDVTLIAVDVTQRIQAEAQLNHERARAQEYANIAGVIVLALDTAGNIDLLNRTGHQLLGHQDGTLLGRHWFDFLPHRERGEVQRVFHALMAGEIEPVEFHENSIVTSDGEERLVAWNNSLIKDAEGVPVGTLSSGCDITDQRAAQEVLRQAHEELEHRVELRTAELTRTNTRLWNEIQERKTAEEQLQVIYDGMADGLLISNVHSKRLVRANAAICRMLGYSEEELLRMNVMDIHPSDQVERVMDQFNANLNRINAQPNLRTSVADNTPLQRRNGSVFYSDITASLVVYNGDLCLLAFFRDITERKVAQERLQREHHVLRELLKSQDRERQLVAYEIHDGLAQQLVGAIMQFETIEILISREPAEAVASCVNGLDMLRKSLAEARRLIGGLRPPILDELGVVAAVGHIVHELSNLDGPTIEYSSEVEFDRLEPVMENTIYRIIQECLTNACRYSRSEKVHVTLTQVAERLRIEVTDWGIGFDPHLEREGSFGLEGIKERARLIGGSASVSSEMGTGTRVYVELPLADT